METKKREESLPIMTDEVIIERILKGETELFEILLRRYNQILYRTVRSYLNDGSEIEDVMQDTYINAFQKLYQFSNKSLFSTWLIRIGINEALQKNRKLSKLRLQTTPLDEKIYQLPDNTTMNQENKIAQKEKASFIERAFENLPEKYRIVFMFNEVEGMTVSEISKCLGISQSNVKVRLHRGRTMMKESLLCMVNKSELFEFGNSRCDRVVDYVMKTINNL
ncbi:MAG: RNA polymerase sigma factor [Flavobacterium sp.]|uniref:RNA polymerase sigma factor n=1 Tax=Flavobacterium sp. TaxID=239 RepID=UPI0025C4FE0E|nr:RNA polymerase sigma factor [Flavobacterium sp.]MCK6607653.1 RNA polymerase sigma factor [Flavobacterium sp.]